ncbi:AAA family ATPase [Streptomyces sp. NPDC044780]|uniref:AAA family ATPase n=1 Tax=unclassified Streptomyces TaxID=2593676 RepID=UPI0033CFAF94
MLPVLWLCGPPGVGKTTVAWELYSQLAQAGTEVGFIDIDQLGICYPEPATDPGRHRMKARNLDAVAGGFLAAGVECLIVSGVVDPARGVHTDSIPRAAPTVCRLRAGHDELRRRFIGRGGDATPVEDVLREADALDRSAFADACVDTSGLPVSEVARRVLARVGAWPPPQSQSVGAVEPPGGAVNRADGPVLWVCGATGVGKSAVGFAVYRRILRAGYTAAYLDLDQIGCRGPVPADDADDHRLKAGNLAALWRNYRTAGARALVVTGPVRDEAALMAYGDALSPAEITLCRLHAGREELTQRIIRRGHGEGWQQPGDPLRRQPTTRLLGIADQAVASAALLESAGIGDLRLDTDGHTVEQVADAVLARTQWPRCS